ncbi:MAG TPA: hypothetical protein VFN99_03945 [Gaiella sp.]|nr:hypothetical protein [Gaiella sp.]
MKLVDQWQALERRLPDTWERVALRLRTEQPNELGEAARILGPMGVGRVGETLAFEVRRAGGPAGPEAARRLFARLDDARVWCLLEQDEIVAREPARAALDQEQHAMPAPASLAQAWDEALAELPPDWSDLLCLLELDSSALLSRAALLTAPLNPTRDRERVGFTFRAARRAGYGTSATMTRRCLERLDGEGIGGRVTVLRALSDTDNVATQGPVWYVQGRAL